MSYINSFIESFVHLFSIDLGNETIVEEAVIGEPRFDECWGKEIPDSKFVIPLFADGYKSPDMMLFDIPEPNGECSDKLNNFLDLFDIGSTVNLEDVIGETISIEVQSGGSVVIRPDVNQ